MDQKRKIEKLDTRITNLKKRIVSLEERKSILKKADFPKLLDDCMTKLFKDFVMTKHITKRLNKIKANILKHVTSYPKKENKLRRH